MTSRVAGQIAAYCVSAFAGGIFFILWRLMGTEDRRRVWRLYGWYSALMFCGSCFGAVAWAARMMSLVNGLKANLGATPNSVEHLSWSAFHLNWRAVFLVTYAIEFMCLNSAQLMVLDRMTIFIAPQGDSMRKSWAAGQRVVMATVVLGNVVGLAANVAAAARVQKVSEAFSTASALIASNNTKDGLEYIASANVLTEVNLISSMVSVQYFCEVAVLLLIIAVFAVVAVLCAHRISSVLTVLGASGPEMISAGLRMQLAAIGKQLRQEVVVTTGFVFVAFLLRAVASTMLAVAFQFQDTRATGVCPGAISVCDECYNVFTHMLRWSTFTPEFQTLVVFASSPLALLVALWGMTSKLALQLMTSRNTQETAVMGLI